MKILIICSDPGSLVNFRYELIKQILSKSHEVHCCGPSLNDEINKMLKDLGVVYHEVGFIRNKIAPLADIKNIFSLYMLYKSVNPDRILAYTIKPVIWGGIANRFYAKSKFFALITGLGYTFNNDNQYKSIFRRITIFLYKISLYGSTTVIFQNKDNLKVFLNEKIITDKQSNLVNGSGVDLSFFRYEPLSISLDFVMIARLLIDKGVYEYIRSAKNVKKLYPTANFTLIGPSEDSFNSVNIEEINNLHSKGIIHYVGPVDDVRKFLRRANIFVLPSYHEGIPRSSLEAMAMGRPLITTNAPGCRDTIIDYSNGRLVKPKSKKDLTEKIIWMIENNGKWQQMGLASYKMAKNKFDVRLVNKAMMEILNI